jgi:transcriptional regulator with XRE-family HTH domain
MIQLLAGKHGMSTTEWSVNLHFAERLQELRKDLGLSQADAALRAGVRRQSYAVWERGEAFPDARSLDGLMRHGFDVMYLLTGRRDPDALSNEEQNLIDAYKDAPDHLKRAAFAVLISPYSSDAKNAQTTPGWYRHELMGEEDVRYPEHMQAERAKQAAGTDTSAPQDVGGSEPEKRPLVGERTPPARRRRKAGDA